MILNYGRLSRLLCYALSFVLVASTFCCLSSVVFADEIAKVENIADSHKESEGNYSKYIEGCKNEQSVQEKIVLLNQTAELKTAEVLSFSFSVSYDTAFYLSLTYRNSEKRDSVFSFSADGQIPFFEAENLSFPTYWKDKGDVLKDSSGNEFSSEQIISDRFVTDYARNYTGEYEDAYKFLFKSGQHSVTLKLCEGSLTIKEIALVPVKEIPEYTFKDKIDGKSDYYEVIEGETAALKSSSSLISLSDDSSATVNPTSVSNARINYIGGTNWSKQNDTIIWDFNVKQSGYYYFGFLYRQSAVLGGMSYRSMKIDGEIPFKEANRIKFRYGTSWDYTEFGADAPYYIYLEKGSHTISLSATSGELADIYKQLKSVTSDMGDIYIDITMVIGETVDVSRSYELFNQIPDFNNRLKSCSQRLEKIAEKIEKLQEKNGGSNVSTIRSAVATIEKMYKNPYSAHKYKSAFYTGYTNLSALLGTFTDMPLDIDRIFVVKKGTELKNPCAGVFKKIAFSTERFINSFSSGYRKKLVNGDGLTIWVNWGRDQTQVLESMIQSDFTPKTGINVSVKLVNATLIQAILSGSGPDVMLHMSRTEPVNLAMRGALIDLSQFSDYKEVMKRFTEDGEVPFKYNGKVYALPDTLGFYVMFARTDILEELGLSVPETWDEFIYTMTVLQHKNLQVSLPYTAIADSTTVNVGVAGLSLYPTLLAQNGLSLYNKSHTKSTLTSESQISVFTDWVNFYNKYKVPVTMDFYNRFRIGSAPLGIASYTLYTQLQAAAPEIENRWTVAMIPGTVGQDGKINRTSAASGTGCSITKLSKNKQNAWEFLKWWTDGETQLSYSERLESVLGPLGRLATANTEALNSMIWDNNMLGVLNAQLSELSEVPEVPGGYYVARGIDQAFWNVVEQNQNSTDMMLQWGAVVDGEIERKRQEFITEN